jgi:hypothetical protein
MRAARQILGYLIGGCFTASPPPMEGATPDPLLSWPFPAHGPVVELMREFVPPFAGSSAARMFNADH